MKSFLRTLIAILGTVLMGVVTYYFVFIRPMASTPPPVLGELKNFSLVDVNGESFGKDRLDGKVWVADLIFTSCPMTCPLMTKRMKNVYLSYALEDNVRFVSVSVDPKNDTPQVLRDYAAKNDINNDKWYFLTGEMDAIRELAVNGFKLVTADDPNLHSNRFVLVDQKSQVRGYYDPSDREDLRKLFHEMALILKEGQDT